MQPRLRTTRTIAVALLIIAAAFSAQAKRRDKEKTPAPPLGCWRFVAPPGWATCGHAGDVICLERDRFVLLGADDCWDGWQVRWEQTPDGWRALATGTPLVQRLAVHWDVGRAADGGLWFEGAMSGGRIGLAPLARAAERAAAQRRSAAVSVTADCDAARKCLPLAPPSVRDLVDDGNLYSARACRMVLSSTRSALFVEKKTVPAACESH